MARNGCREKRSSNKDAVVFHQLIRSYNFRKKLRNTLFQCGNAILTNKSAEKLIQQISPQRQKSLTRQVKDKNFKPAGGKSTNIQLTVNVIVSNSILLFKNVTSFVAK